MPMRFERIAKFIERLPESYEIGQLEDGRIVIYTSETYPDGDVITLFLEEHEDCYILSDAGDTLSTLYTMFGSHPSQEFVEAILTNSRTNVYYLSGELRIEFRSLDNLSEAARELARVAKEVADIYAACIAIKNAKFHVMCSKCDYHEDVVLDKVIELCEYGCERCGGKILIIVAYRRGRIQEAMIFAGSREWADVMRGIKQETGG